jgi:hypothetical protein
MTPRNRPADELRIKPDLTEAEVQQLLEDAARSVEHYEHRARALGRLGRVSEADTCRTAARARAGTIAKLTAALERQKAWVEL